MWRRECVAWCLHSENYFEMMIKQACRSVFIWKSILLCTISVVFISVLLGRVVLFFFSFRFVLLAVLVTHGSCRYTIMGTSTPFMNSRQLTGLIKSLLKPSTCS